MEKVKVIINSDGITCKEVNNVPKPVAGYYDNHDPYDEVAWERAKQEWQEAESKLRTFRIDNVFRDGNDPSIGEFIPNNWLPGSIHDAEIIEGTKIKILS